MADVSFQDVTKEFPGATVAVDRLTLDIPDGELMILVEPSDCGKTTALRLVAGLETATSGAITIAGKNVTYLPPRDRDIAMVFQNYALYPHRTVYKNLAFGLRQRKTARGEIERRVTEVSAMPGLEELLARRPAQLSGGQRQRVAMGRALVREPKAFLLDEPLAHLDAKLGVSTASIRRDLQLLEKQRLLSRTHGGAVANSTAHELPLRYRGGRHHDDGGRAQARRPPGAHRGHQRA